MSLCAQPYAVISAESRGDIVGYKIIMENIRQGQVVDVNEGYRIAAPNILSKIGELFCLGYCSYAYDRYRWFTMSEFDKN